MVLVDYNQIAIANVFAFQKDLKKADEEEAFDIMRHAIISSLVYYKNKFGGKFGEFVITADSGNYWRTQAFPHYKASRKKSREESDLPWDTIFKCMNTVRGDIIKHFPWKLLYVPECESDDIVAVMVQYLQENELRGKGLYEEPQPTIAVASDTDHSQLYKFENYHQWCPLKKAYLPRLSNSALKKHIIEHIVKGDTGDGIPNIFMRDSFFVDRAEKERQKIVSQEVLDLFESHGEDAFEMLPHMNKKETASELRERIELAKKRYKQNESLVMYDHIPDQIKDKILGQYKSYEVKGSQGDVMSYFIKHRMRLLMEEIDSI